MMKNGSVNMKAGATLNSFQLIGRNLAKFLMLLLLVVAVAAPQLLWAQSATPVVKGSVYGGGRKANVGSNDNSNAKVQMMNGEVQGSIYGGNDISGNTGNKGTDFGVIVTGGVVNGDVFGGANGYYGCHTTTEASGSVYTDKFDSDNPDITNTTPIPTITKTYVKINGGTVKGSVYGGGNLAPVSNSTDKNGVVKVDIIQGTIGTSDHSTPGNVFTGGNMASVYASSNPQLTVNNRQGGVFDLYIHGGVYGGNDKSGTIKGDNDLATSVTIAGAPNYIGDVFGGGNGDYTYFTDKTSYENSSATNKVFGCSTSKPDQTAGTTVTINTTGGYIARVFGGGNSATVGTPTVNFAAGSDVATGNGHDGNHVGQIFGGNNSVALASVPVINLTRGQVAEVYGGGNAGAITATSGSETVSSTNYSGLSTKILMTESTNNVKVGTVYGGGRMAGTDGGTLVCLNSTKTEVGTIYGGCNISGNVTGTSNVVFLQGTVTKALFGGANGEYGCPGENGKYASDFDSEDDLTVTGQDMPSVLNSKVDIKGTLGTESKKVSVYGGGNLAPMGGSSNNANATVTIVNNAEIYGTVYGGGNMAAVNGNATVNFNGGTLHGNLFGGNDKSGNVTVANVTIKDGKVDGSLYGGGNGNYNYSTNTDIPYDCMRQDGEGHAKTPFCTTTYVNINGGEIGSWTDDKHFASVYGGGLAGDCQNTNLVINDAAVGGSNATIHGKIFGGGEGQMTTVKDDRVGNITGTAKTDLYHLHALGISGHAVVYGGGNAGDVANTVMQVHDSWNLTLDTLYGGCNAADISVLAKTTIGAERTWTAGHEDDHYRIGPQEGNEQTTAHVIYGGNDFAGNVANTLLEVNGGKYDYLYGGGNGEYTYTGSYDSYTYPVSKDITVVINDGDFVHNVYGGGNLAKAGSSTADAASNASTNPADYGVITLTVHGGTFGNHIFTGGRGDGTKEHQVVYGLKVFNMDGGHVTRSVYGGSESVNDGYPLQCTGNTTTSMRPSSILNIVGGEIHNNVYGGGYLGLIYGSVYVNIGKKAVEDCFAWKRTYPYVAPTPSTGDNNNVAPLPLATSATPSYSRDNYVTFVSNVVRTNEANTLLPRVLVLDKSVYNGSDWGDAQGQAEFSSAGFYGGESRIIVDGYGYNTHHSTSSAGAGLPAMNIAGSLFGSGTSCEGGDVYRNIILRNYGDYECNDNLPQLSREMKSIQRADSVLISNSYVRFTGTQDCYSAYVSSTYSFSRINRLMVRGNNYLSVAAPSLYLSALEFQNNNGTISNTPQDKQALFNSVVYCIQGSESTAQPEDTARLNKECCAQRPLCNKIPKYAEYPKLYIEDGVYLDVIDPIGNYGPIQGYAYLLAADGTQAYVTARRKITQYDPEYTDATPNTDNLDDGGFYYVCNGENVHLNGTNYPEYPYTNYSSLYRTWNFGDAGGSRKRQVTIVAHADPEKLAFDAQKRKTGYNTALPAQDINAQHQQSAADEFAYSQACLHLPPTMPGHKYKITSINVDLSNGGQLILNKEAFLPSADNSTSGEWKYYVEQEADPSANPPVPEINTQYDRTKIIEDPTYTFGLMFALGNKFKTVPTASDQQKNCLVWGNNRIDALNGFTSTPVDDSPDDVTNVIPDINFYLTYSRKFSSTILRDVIFTLEEVDANGNSVAPIEVTVTISTVVSDFKDEEFHVLAMYNEGITNHYTHKVLLPASLIQRELYLTKIEWENNSKITTSPVDPTASGNHYFNLSNIVNEDDANTLNKYHFGMSVELSEDLTSSVNSQLGWYEMKQKTSNLYTLGGNPTNDYACTKTFDGDGLPIGVLDGRSPAAVNMSLWYNGNEVFEKDDTIGNVTLSFRYYQGPSTPENPTFKIICHVKSREHGDTIYIASAGDEGVMRNGCTVHKWAPKYDESVPPKLTNLAEKGKSPNNYVQTFDEALSSEVYQEGDVLCILDQVIMPTNYNRSIRGGEFGMLQLIRYTGRHYEFPGERCAYRGPMIVMNSNSRFSCYDMRIDGGGICKTLKGYTSTENNSLPSSIKITSEQCNTAGGNITEGWSLPADNLYYYKQGARLFDTTLVMGPIFELHDEATLTLADKVLLLHNFSQNGDVSSGHAGGAVAMYGGDNGKRPTLYVNNNIEFLENGVLHNSSATNEGAAVYVNNGIVYMGNYADGAVIKVKDNFYVEQWNATAESTRVLTGNPTSAKFQLVNINSRTTANNVYLTRTPLPEKDLLAEIKRQTTSMTEEQIASYVNNKTDAQITSELNGMTTGELAAKKAEVIDTKDKISDIVQYLTEINPESRIGITKAFPGPTSRDTIRVVKSKVTNQLTATRVAQNHVFLSDEDIRTDVDAHTFYHPYLDPYTLYFHRCATFKKQLGPGTEQSPNVLYYHTYNGEGEEVFVSQADPNVSGQTINVPKPILQVDQLAYAQNATATCPTEPDVLKFSLYGGFYPYTFTWYDYSTPASETQILQTKSPIDATSKQKRGNQSRWIAANTGNFPMTNITDVTFGSFDKTYPYHVVATDLAGCRQERYATVRVVKTNDATISDVDFLDPGQTIADIPTENGKVKLSEATDHKFSDDVAESTKDARALRIYKGVNVYTEVVPNNSWGTIAGSIIINNGTQSISNFQKDNTDGSSTYKKNTFCVGDVINLNITDASDKQFVMWDFDPNAPKSTQYIVTGQEDGPIGAIYGGSDYWTGNVTSEPEDGKYVTDRGGNVTITSAEGLAWLISVVNGLNNQTARAFVFDTVFLEAKDNEGNYKSATWDMSAHKWTPIGTPNHPFRGRFYVKNNLKYYNANSDASLTIKGITVNEPNMQQVGLFGMIDTAQVRGLHLEDVIINGSQYGGALAGVAKDAIIEDNQVTGDATIITSDNVIGGLVGSAYGTDDTKTTLNMNKVAGSKLIGTTVYGGGLVGMGSNLVSKSNSVDNLKMNRMTSVYEGGLIGKLDGCPFQWDSAYVYNDQITGVWIDIRSNSVVLKPSDVSTHSGEPYGEDDNLCDNWNQGNNSKDATAGSMVMNNYVNYTSSPYALYSGGLVGMAANSRIENNYTYGKSAGLAGSGALVGEAVEGVSVADCYFLDGTAQQGIGIDDAGANVNRVNRFRGTGNQVLVDSVSGVNNLTRLLNRWVRRNGPEDYSSWRSAQGTENSGYPVFGEPDFIPVFDTMNITTCDFYQWNANDYTETGIYSQLFHDTVEYVDSTMTLYLTINESMLTEYFDSAALGNNYQGHGFNVTATELELLRSTVEEFGSATLLVADTLNTVHGCDSVIALHLTVFNNQGVNPISANDLKVYPNPTVSHVDVEMEGMTQVEVYDNVSRQVMSVTAQADRCRVDMSALPSGYYYFRIHSARGVAIKKVVKR